MEITLKIVKGQEIAPYIKALGKLRITIFREYPYLYDGDAAYEEKYLTRYQNCPDALIVLAIDQETNHLVGMSSCLPLTYEEEFKDPFLKHGLNPAEIFYFGESILLPEYRGLGLGKKFFDLREDHAHNTLKDSLKFTAFCAVNRKEQAPTNYQSPEFLWRKRGYTKHPELVATFNWKDIGEKEVTPKSLTFWLKEHS